jgi:hypothetical protein
MTAYCIFQEPWWLDAVAEGAWQAIEIVHGGQVVARMPIVLRRKFGFRIIRQPPLTPVLGPWLRAVPGNPARQNAREKELLTELISRLPRWDWFEASFHHRMTNWLPFYWRGFQQTTRYTYLLDDTSDLDAVWTGLHESVRRNIRKARRQLGVGADIRLERLLDAVELTFLRQGQTLPFSRELMFRIDAACFARGARRTFFAEDARRRIHAVLYLVMDGRCAYYLLGGADPEVRESGAQNLLLWEAIRCASEMGRAFDFEGSMIEPVERVFRDFGARQAPYLHVYGGKPLARAVLHLAPKRLLRASWRSQQFSLSAPSILRKVLR